MRTLAYMNAITKNPELIKDKIVLDIGCGTGILSIFAARAGAKHVYAIENAGIANHVLSFSFVKGFLIMCTQKGEKDRRREWL